MIEKIFSKRTNKEEDLELYENNGSLIVKHASLDQIFWGMPDNERPDIKWEIADQSKFPYTHPVKAIELEMKKDSFYIKTVGELSQLEWEKEDDIVKKNPLQICINRAFDKAFIRFMQFDVGRFSGRTLYSSEEIRGAAMNQTKEVPAAGYFPEEQDFYPKEPQPEPVYQREHYAPEPSRPVSQPQTVGGAPVPVQQPVNAPNVPQEAKPIAQQQVPTPIAERPKPPEIEVSRVFFDKQTKRADIETNLGVFYYDPRKLDFVNLNKAMLDPQVLYTETSRFLNADLYMSAKGRLEI